MENVNNRNVCDNQSEFNRAFREAVKNMQKKQIEDMGGWVYVLIAVYFLFLYWAVMLALKVDNKELRTVHLVWAILASPVYVIASYAGNKSSALI